MSIRPSIESAAQVSPELSDLIEQLLEDPDREPIETLGEVREHVLRHSGDGDTAFLDPADREALLAELDSLAQEFGEDAPAGDFIAPRIGEALSRAIEAAMSDPAVAEEPTLGAVREAMVNGLAARLVSSEAIDGEDEGTLLEELDELIRRYGEDAPAEYFVVE
jgi:hypothetical protein